ncbi:MAG: hypothetical protein IJU37_07880 [Desulfovibrio sp.]|nr:hypothetical protein [Desulfovibrio sp.]
MKYFPLLLALTFFMPTCCFAADPPSIVFCESFDDNWKAKKKGTEFYGTTISWMATATKPYGLHRIILSVYRQDGAKETLVARKNIDVNPEWDTTGIRYMSMPAEGEYTLALTTPDGNLLNKGMVKLFKGNSLAVEHKEETLGAKLEALFKKYAPQKEE